MLFVERRRLAAVAEASEQIVENPHLEPPGRPAGVRRHQQNAALAQQSFLASSAMLTAETGCRRREGIRNDRPAVR